MTRFCSSPNTAILVPAALLGLLLVPAMVPTAGARMAREGTLADLVTSAARIIRARCIAADNGTVDVAGARLPSTTYTFEVADPLKGAGTGPLVFRQIGIPAGGARDLGARAGLPVYTPGAEYVLFLLPESTVGLTSPAGAGDGAFVVHDEHVVSMNGAVRFAGRGPASPGARMPAGAESAEGGRAASLPYETFRALVRDLVTP